MLNKIKYIFVLLFVVLATAAFAQRDTSLTREVEVTKAFKPIIVNANKINEMPKINETKHQKPVFDYSIYSQPILNTFSVTQLKAATIDNAKKKNTGMGLVRVGVGNYNKPYGELFFNNLISKNSIFGVHVKHLSSFGKVTLDGGDKVDAPFAKNVAEAYYKYNFSKSVLSVNADFNHNRFNYYGYPEVAVPEVLLDENQNLTYQGRKQAFSKSGISVSLKNPTAELDDPVFNFDAKYYYFKTNTKQSEYFGELDMNLQKPLDNSTVLMDGGVLYVQANNILNRTLAKTGSRGQFWLFAKPAWYYAGKIANIKAGFNAWFIMDNDEDAIAKVAPNVRFEFTPVKDIVSIYAGIDGNYINNHYSKIAYNNPFVNPAHDVKNSFEKIHFYGGFDGKLSKKTNFKISADYSLIDDQPFYYLNKVYVNATPSQLIVNNTFDILYDNLNLLKLNFEIFHTSSEKLNLLLSGNYYGYNLDKQAEAWNMPRWDATFSADYKITEQLSVGADIYLIGERKALAVQPGAPPNVMTFAPVAPIKKTYNLDTVFDLNLNATYKITQKFSAFGQLNNFGFQKYQRWLGYNVQSFNVLLGVSYAF
jgi:hypothetical protein